MIPSGVVQRDERKRTADERSKQNRRCQNRGRESLRDESGRSPEARPRRHPAERRREPEPGSCMERENLSSRCQGKGSSGQPLRDSSTDAGHRGRTARSRVEGVVMTLDRRGCGVQPCVRPTGDGRSRVIKAKPFDIPKREVWEAFKHVKANQGAAGVDGQSIEDFEARLGDNLYKLWNRLSSGSYMPPPVRRVDIAKATGGTRPLGIPTVADRVAQEVVRRYLEPSVATKTPMDIGLGVPLSMRSERHASGAGTTIGSLISTSKASSTASIMCCCCGLCASTLLARGCCSTSSAG